MQRDGNSPRDNAPPPPAAAATADFDVATLDDVVALYDAIHDTVRFEEAAADAEREAARGAKATASRVPLKPYATTQTMSDGGGANGGGSAASIFDVPDDTGAPVTWGALRRVAGVTHGPLAVLRASMPTLAMRRNDDTVTFDDFARVFFGVARASARLAESRALAESMLVAQQPPPAHAAGHHATTTSTAQHFAGKAPHGDATTQRNARRRSSSGTAMRERRGLPPTAAPAPLDASNVQQKDPLLRSTSVALNASFAPAPSGAYALSPSAAMATSVVVSSPSQWAPFLASLDADALSATGIGREDASSTDKWRVLHGHLGALRAGRGAGPAASAGSPSVGNDSLTSPRALRREASMHLLREASMSGSPTFGSPSTRDHQSIQDVLRQRAAEEQERARHDAYRRDAAALADMRAPAMPVALRSHQQQQPHTLALSSSSEFDSMPGSSPGRSMVHASPSQIVRYSDRTVTGLVPTLASHPHPVEDAWKADAVLRVRAHHAEARLRRRDRALRTGGATPLLATTATTDEAADRDLVERAKTPAGPSMLCLSLSRKQSPLPRVALMANERSPARQHRRPSSRTPSAHRGDAVRRPSSVAGWRTEATATDYELRDRATTAEAERTAIAPAAFLRKTERAARAPPPQALSSDSDLESVDASPVRDPSAPRMDLTLATSDTSTPQRDVEPELVDYDAPLPTASQLATLRAQASRLRSRRRSSVRPGCFPGESDVRTPPSKGLALQLALWAQTAGPRAKIAKGDGTTDLTRKVAQPR